MENNFIITTTNSLEGYEIEKYYGYISVNYVTGANIFRDMFAGIADTFGGISQGYTDELDEIKDLAIESIKSKAQMLGMNGVIGLKIDLDPIFGPSRSMFMVSATGTAVKIAELGGHITEEEKIQNEILRSIKSIAMVGDATGYGTDFKTIPLLKLESFLLSADKEYSTKIIEELLLYAKKNPLGLHGTNLAVKRKVNAVKNYIHKIDRSYYIDTLIGEMTKENVTVMKALEIVDYDILLNKFRSVNNQNEELLLISALDTVPQVIKKEDYKSLGELISFLESKYNDKVEIKQTGIMKKTDMWVCKKCKTSCDLEDRSCPLCQHNRYGLPSATKYNNKIVILKNIYKLLEKYYG